MRPTIYISLISLLLSGCTGPLLSKGGEFLDGESGEPPLYIASSGRGEPVLIVLHGGPGLSHDYLRPEWDRLGGHGWRVVFYD